jgi:YHS domain-containing protein
MLPATGTCDDVSAMEAGSTLDPVCGRAVDPLRARAVGIFGGTTYYFCSADCKSRYADPRAPRDPSETARPPSKAVAPVVTPAPTRVEAPRAARPATEAPTEAPPAQRRSSRGPIILGFVVVAAGAAVWGLRERPSAKPPVPPVPVVAAPVTPTAALPPPAPAVATTPAPADHAMSAITAPLKLGLRRFVAHAEDGATLSWQLLVIDASGRAVPIVVAELPSSEDEAKSVTEEAVAPQADFLSARREPGTIFQDSFHAQGRRLDVRVTRAADLLTAETRESAETGDAEAAPWHRRVHLPLEESDLVRGAPFARKRYSEDY